MEILVCLILILQVVLIYLQFSRKKVWQNEVRSLYSSIARDLNNITATIAIYAGQSVVPPSVQDPDGALPVDPVESLRRKAEIWRSSRQNRRR